MQSSYQSHEVILLLKDITGRVTPQSAKERERLIQSGRHYCEMLPIEYAPSKAYMEAYEHALAHYGPVTAKAVGRAAEKILNVRGKDVVLVSLARAGIPIGVLMKHYLEHFYGISVPHYAVSIIRGRGLDHNAMEYLLERYQPRQLQFVDGWIGKGAILSELNRELAARYPGVPRELAVAADPAYLTRLCGTHEDILIPSSCLNSTVSGLISRTFLRDDIIGEKDFHGAVYYGELANQDLSHKFLKTIEEAMEKEEVCAEDAWVPQLDTEGVRGAAVGATAPNGQGACRGLEEVKRIQKKHKVEDINFIKPGIGEATRVLLRRVPWKILIRKEDQNHPMLRHLLRLAKEKETLVEFEDLQCYRACGIIKKLADL